MKTFEDIFNQYSEEVKAKSDDGEHKLGQIREKYTELIDAAGIDKRMLKSSCVDNPKEYEKQLALIKDVTPYLIPDESASFVVELLKKHTSKDFKRIRRGDFSEASGKELKWLVDGFTQLLYSLGYPIYAVLEQKNKMEERFHLKRHMALERIRNECDELIKQAESYTGLNFQLNDDDQDYFLPYMASAIAGLREHLAFVHSAYSDIRSDEIYDLALEESKNLTIEDMEKDAEETEAIVNDKELQELIKQRDELVGSYDFVKNKRKAYHILSMKIEAILDRHHQEVYGSSIKKGDRIILKHPIQVLIEALTYVADCSDYENFQLQQLAKSREQIEYERKEAETMMKEMEARFCKRKGQDCEEDHN